MLTQALRLNAYRQLANIFSAHMSQVLHAAGSIHSPSFPQELIEQLLASSSAAALCVGALTPPGVQRLLSSGPQLPHARALLARAIRTAAWLWRKRQMVGCGDVARRRRAVKTLSLMVVMALTSEVNAARDVASSSSSSGASSAATPCPNSAVSMAAMDFGCPGTGQ